VLGLQPLTRLPLPALAALSLLITPNPSKGFMVRGIHPAHSGLSCSVQQMSQPYGRIRTPMFNGFAMKQDCSGMAAGGFVPLFPGLLGR